jgi:hypothetical protein
MEKEKIQLDIIGFSQILDGVVNGEIVGGVTK